MQIITLKNPTEQRIIEYAAKFNYNIVEFIGQNWYSDLTPIIDKCLQDAEAKQCIQICIQHLKQVGNGKSGRTYWEIKIYGFVPGEKK